ncbi:MAG: PEP-CTERM sorting domain-containing protein, partial [Chthoniobacteraceae bacterium]
GIVNTSATATVAGGTLKIGDSVVSQVQTFNSLTLSGTSVLDFGNGGGLSGNNQLVITNGASSFAGALKIYNWTGSIYAPTTLTDDGTFAQDRLLFGTSTGWTTGQLANITFYSDSGMNAIGFGAAEINFTGGGPSFEIVPVPEPATTALIGSVALCALIGYRERRRFAGVRSRGARK